MCVHSAPEKNWFLYIIRYSGNKLYTGVSTDVVRRLAQHGSGCGAKSLRGKQDLCLVFSVLVGSRSEAQRLEYRVKQLSKRDKERLVSGMLVLADITAATHTRCDTVLS